MSNDTDSQTEKSDCFLGDCELLGWNRPTGAVTAQSFAIFYEKGEVENGIYLANCVDCFF